VRRSIPPKSRLATIIAFRGLPRSLGHCIALCPNTHMCWPARTVGKKPCSPRACAATTGLPITVGRLEFDFPSACAPELGDFRNAPAVIDCTVARASWLAQQFIGCLIPRATSRSGQRASPAVPGHSLPLWLSPQRAADSLATAFGSNLAPRTKTGSAPYPSSLGGISLQVVDSLGAQRIAQLLYVSPGQIKLPDPGRHRGRYRDLEHCQRNGQRAQQPRADPDGRPGALHRER
jgi:hypothetical protein